MLNEIFNVIIGGDGGPLRLIIMCNLHFCHSVYRLALKGFSVETDLLELVTRISQSVFRPLSWAHALYFVIALCTLMQSKYAWAQCTVQDMPSCNVYNTCFDRYCRCTGADNYFISYGQKYCNRFLNETGWSPAGKQWRDKTLLCLQKSIAAKLSLLSPATCSCREMKEFAFQTHINCYTQNAASVCNLPIADWRRIVSIIDTADFIDSYGASQVMATLEICLSNYSDEVAADIKAKWNEAKAKLLSFISD